MAVSSISTLEAKEQFTDLINRVAHHHERIILTRRGKDIAALIPLEDWHLIQATADKQDLEAALEALKEARAKGTLHLKDLPAKSG